MQVTISLLPVSLSLVHIPRSRLPALSHPVLKQILQPSPSFLNITCNEIELSVFAEDHILEDFEPIARKDRQRKRSKSLSRKKSSLVAGHCWEPVEISYDKWSVLQIDSHSDQIGNSGARVNELSAPLAEAGISILYQSSYMSDFIILKESRLQEALNLFASAGFDLYTPHEASSPPGSSSHSPIREDQFSFRGLSSKPSTILTRCTEDSDTLSPIIPTSVIQNTSMDEQSATTPDFVGSQKSSRDKSHSPTKGEVHVLSPDLACVGLSDEIGVDHWGLKIVKLVAFPDLIPLPNKSQPTHKPPYPTPVLSPLSELHSPLLTNLDFTRARAPSFSSESSSEEEGYFSHSPATQASSTLPTPASRSYTDLPKVSPCDAFKPPSKHLISTIPTLSPLHLPDSLGGMTDAQPNEANDHILRVPFFSFTRTAEGSSLTADVSTLAALFPPYERHMVICSGELDAIDARSTLGGPSSESDEEEDTYPDSGIFKCLQIDLRRFGLDKYGLVNRFSRVLEENDINHMYSSTFKTANLLVDKKHAVKARALLRGC